MDVHILQFRQRHALADGPDIERLSPGHAPGTARLRQYAHHFQLDPGGQVRIGPAEQFEGHGLERIAHEHGGGFVVGAVAGGLAAPQVVVVHGGQIVVHQGIAVDEFHRAGGRIEIRQPASHGQARGIDQQRPYPFAAVESRIAHRLVETPGNDVVLRQHPFQLPVHPAGAGRGELRKGLRCRFTLW